MRTTKEERARNIRKFYNAFTLNDHNTAVVIVKKTQSKTNPYINRTQFLAVCSNFQGNLEVIAESATEGIQGCFMELLKSIKNIEQVSYYDKNFKTWLKKNYGFSIPYFDGVSFIFER